MEKLFNVSMTLSYTVTDDDMDRVSSDDPLHAAAALFSGDIKDPNAGWYFMVQDLETGEKRMVLFEDGEVVLEYDVALARMLPGDELTIGGAGDE